MNRWWCECGPGLSLCFPPPRCPFSLRGRGFWQLYPGRERGNFLPRRAESPYGRSARRHARCHCPWFPRPARRRCGLRRSLRLLAIRWQTKWRRLQPVGFRSSRLARAGVGLFTETHRLKPAPLLFRRACIHYFADDFLGSQFFLRANRKAPVAGLAHFARRDANFPEAHG
jgi:hypothetical protein